MNRELHSFVLSFVSCALITAPYCFSKEHGTPSREQVWKRHIIDGSSRGADGERLHDVNKDGLPDVTTGWEEGGVTRAYIHPGYKKVKEKWPAVTVGQTRSVEDAVFCDLDNDGAVDVISSCEGGTKCVFVHWAPKPAEEYLRDDAWKMDAFPATKGKTSWMFALPMQIDGKHGADIVIAAKSKDAMVAWLQAPSAPRDTDAWKLHKLYEAGWIMSLAPADLDSDGDLDVVVSDRKGRTAGALWLENPGPKAAEGDWPEHRIGASGLEIMFLDVVDLDGDGRRDVVTAVKQSGIHWFKHPADPTQPWPGRNIKVKHPEGMGTGKGVRVGDIDGDGKLDIVYSCENASPPKRGVVWLSYSEKPTDENWTTHDISGPEGTKFDRIELVDLDGDGDLDVMTCEERHKNRGLGVFWYENPSR